MLLSIMSNAGKSDPQNSNKKYAHQYKNHQIQDFVDYQGTDGMILVFILIICFDFYFWLLFLIVFYSKDNSSLRYRNNARIMSIFFGLLNNANCFLLKLFSDVHTVLCMFVPWLEENYKSEKRKLVRIPDLLFTLFYLLLCIHSHTKFSE